MARHNERITCLIIRHQQPTPITSGARGSATVRTQLSGGLAMVAAEGWTAGSVVPNRPQERGLLIRRKTTDLPPTLFYSKEHKEPYRGAPTLASPGFHGLELHGTLPAPPIVTFLIPLPPRITSFWLISLCIIGSSFILLIRTESSVFFLMAE